MSKEEITCNPKETRKLGEKLAKKALKKEDNNSVFALLGNLGAGKTEFTKGFASGLGIKEKILSPTFVIMKKFPIPSYDKTFYHVDCYRIEDSSDVETINLEEILNDPSSIVCIEWADKIKDILPKKTLFLKFEHLGENKRKINIHNNKVSKIK